MKITVVGFDPSLNHWGIAEGELDLMTGILETPILQVLSPEKVTKKQVRQNSIDLDVAKQLATEAFIVARRAKAIFVEIPVGSQSARAMAAYGICVGVLGALVSEGIQLIEVTATEVKKAITGDSHATKAQMIAEAMKLYPEANFPMHRGKPTLACEHVADAIGAIHAGVNTPLFQNLMKLYA
jgi:Holliday junction resolvasome RuvABC endonuclease subunit